MIEQLAALAIELWTAADPAYAKRPAAAAISRALAEELDDEAEGRKAPTYADGREDLAFAAWFASRESSLQAVDGDCRVSSDPTTCAAHGYWQLHGECGKRSVREQARCWLKILRYSPCHEHPIAIMWGTCSGKVPYGSRLVPVSQLAAEREARVRALLEKTTPIEVSHALEPVRFDRAKAASHDVTLAANAWLTESFSMPDGAEKIVEVDGARWALVAEPHYHPDGFVGGPNGWHRGITVFQVATR